MISSRPLFSGLITSLWGVCLLACLFSGFLQLPIMEYLPINFALFPLIPIHAYGSGGLLFLSTYMLFIWLFQGRLKYKLTNLAKFKILLYSLLIVSGLFLALNVLNILPLLGGNQAYVKLLHALIAILLALLEIMSWLISLFKPLHLLVRRTG
ncbi:MAG: hypothetical protein IJU40_07735 [Desulfovibrionaceae bacterium]|nr:hypothetical protein [Desulfovibrionaceae bacterium]